MRKLVIGLSLLVVALLVGVVWLGNSTSSYDYIDAYGIARKIDHTCHAADTGCSREVAVQPKQNLVDKLLNRNTTPSGFLSDVSLSCGTGVMAGNRFKSDFNVRNAGLPVYPCQPDGWDVQIHERNSDHWDAPTPMPADHAHENCAPEPATFTRTQWEENTYVCNNHFMTVTDICGYCITQVSPPATVDCSTECKIQIDVSSKSDGIRDWWDLAVTPKEDYKVLPLTPGLPDMDGLPNNGYVVVGGHQGEKQSWGFTRMLNGVETNLPTRWSLTIEDALGLLNPPRYESATRRERWVLTITPTVATWCMHEINTDGSTGAIIPAGSAPWDDCFIDLDNLTPLPGMDEARVQIVHHGYTVDKDICPSLGVNAPCQPNTFHWDNFEFEPATPFTILDVGPHRLTEDTDYAISPNGGHLEFASDPGHIGTAGELQVSFTGGSSWIYPTRMPNFKPDPQVSMANYRVTAPDGATTFRWKSTNINNFPTAMFDVYQIQSLQEPLPTATATAVPTATATPTPVPTATATPAPTPAAAERWWPLGADLPWHIWEQDFGGGPSGGGVSNPTHNATISARLATLKQNGGGGNFVRWWVAESDTLDSVPQQITVDGAGIPNGVHANFYADMDAALALAETHDLYYIFTWFNGRHFIPPAWLSDPAKRTALANVLAGVAAHYSGSSRIAAWDLFNEAERAEGGRTTLYEDDTAKADYRAFVSEAVIKIHAATGRSKVGSSLAWPDALGINVGLGLDFFQVHWYPYQDQGTYCVRCKTMQSYVDQFGLTAPLIVGEFPTMTDMNNFDKFHDLGYGGALAWSMFPENTADNISINYDQFAEFRVLNPSTRTKPTTLGAPWAGPPSAFVPPATPTPTPTATVAPRTEDCLVNVNGSWQKGRSGTQC